MPPSLTAIRLALRILPPPLRERWAARLFMARTEHAEPARETSWREQGIEVKVAGRAAVAFGPTDGPPAFLMHGWGGRGLQLAAYIEPLTHAGHRVYALDGPGHGKNGKGIGALPTFTAFLEEAIHELRPAVIVAHSLGSAAAIVAASRTDSQARILCLGGPPETLPIFTRARAFMGLPESGRPRFMRYLMGYFQGFRIDDLMDVEACARHWSGDLHAVLATQDEDVPPEESERIVAAAGGHVTRIDEADHRSVMWVPEAVGAGLAFLGTETLIAAT